MSHKISTPEARAHRAALVVAGGGPELRDRLGAVIGAHWDVMSPDSEERPPDAVALWLERGGEFELERLRETRIEWPDAPVIVLCDHPCVAGAVACMREGAADYLDGAQLDAGALEDSLARLLEFRSSCASSGPCAPGMIDGIVAVSPGMRRVVETVRALAESDSNVLIEAESGTGKELLARAIHDTSSRAGGPFVPVDCGALPEGIAERELFGHERGAFTGAHRSAPGLFRSADGGTLFLDEVGELPPLLQAKLLRALQQREVRPLGSTVVLPVDARIIAATNRDLGEEVRAGRFRADLFYRLRVVSLSIPPLRDRPEDVPALAGRFLASASRGGRIQGFAPEVIEALKARRWEGNVRELQNAIEAAAALSRGPLISLADLRLGGARIPLRPAPRELPLALEAYEAECLREVLKHADGDVARAARILGIGRSTLYRKLARHELVKRS